MATSCIQVSHILIQQATGAMIRRWTRAEAPGRHRGRDGWPDVTARARLRHSFSLSPELVPRAARLLDEINQFK